MEFKNIKNTSIHEQSSVIQVINKPNKNKRLKLYL